MRKSHLSVLFGIIFHTTVLAGSEDSLLQVIDTCRNPEHICRIYEKLHVHFRDQGNQEKCLHYLNCYLEHAIKYNLPKKQAEYHNFNAIQLLIKGQADSAISSYNKGIESYLKLKDTLSTAAFFENLGWAYKDNGQYPKALDALFKAMEIRNKYKQPGRIPSILTTIATVFEKTGRFDKAKEYTLLALQKTKKLPNNPYKQLVSVYNQLGNVYDTDQQYDSAIYFYNIGLQVAKENNWLRGESVLLGNIALIYDKNGDLKKSIETHQQSLQLEIKSNNAYGIIKEHQSLAQLHKKKSNYKEAVDQAKKAYNKSKQTSLIREQASSAKILSEMLSATGKPTEALSLFKEFHELQDSINNAEVKKNTDELEAKYQNRVKEQEIKILKNENTIKQKEITTNRLVVVFMAIFLVLIVTIGRFLFRLRKKQMELKHSDLEQRLLKSQMKPHFLFNVLAAIQSYLSENNTTLAYQYLGDFSRLTRSILTHTSKDTISLEEEIEALKSFLSLHKLLKNNNFNYSIEYSDNLETEFIFIPPMLIQPFVENAIKHGLPENPNEGFILILVSEKDNYIHFTIQDNGPGIEAGKQNTKGGHESYALNIFKERVSIIEQTLGKKIQYKIHDLTKNNGKGTLIKLEIPIFEE